MSQALRLRDRLAMGVSVAAILGLAAPAYAQQQPDDGGAGNVIEEVVVTAQKREERLQDVPIAVSAFTQDALEAQGIEGGPDLQLSIPNVSFSKGNFTGYNFQIRGVGSKVVAGGADTGVGIHLNNAPLTANRLFEAEFYDVERVEVLRGPQGTLYGRNATGGVVNVITAKPTDVFEGDVRAEYGNYNTKRLKGAVNVPITDLVALRLAGSFLQRDGFGDNLVTGSDIDDRDLYAFRATLGFNTGGEGARAFFMYEHFEEDDKRSRIGRQICRKDLGPASVGGVPTSLTPAGTVARGFLSQGCLPSNVTDPASLVGTINSTASLGGGLGVLTGLITGDAYAGKTQSSDLRDIESAIDPIYQATTDLFQLQVEIDVTDSLTLTYLTGYSNDELYTFQDYNRIAPTRGFNVTPLTPGGVFNDPQVGSSNLFRTFDISSGFAEQWSQELRLSSNFDGPINFNVGGIYVNYDATGDYYVFSNTLTAAALALAPPGVIYVDPTPPTSPGPAGDGHNYFKSFGPYQLESTAAFGEVYYEPVEDFKFTLGLRYTKDEKEVDSYLTQLLVPGRGIGEVIPQRIEFEEMTGKIGVDWQPELAFTDDTLLYASYSRGYKAGGFNPPQPAGAANVVAPTFAPEFIDAYEIGTKNTLLSGSLQLNATGFFYNYEGYQISRIVNRTSANDNIDAQIMGLEIETLWEPIDNLRLNANFGFIKTEIADGTRVLDIFDRTQGNPALTVVKASNFSNCVAPTSSVATLMAVIQGLPGAPAVPGVTGVGTSILGLCSGSFAAFGPGFTVGPDGSTTQVNQGISDDISGNSLPNTPETTVSLGAQYTFEFGDTWELTPRVDYYWQAESFTRIYNRSFDELPAYDNINLNVALTNDALGLTVEAYVRNATDEEAITDAYLTDDSSGLFRNLFLVEPRTFGVAVSKSF
jgi:outer membrane receptor protein involved in Fe transport